MDFLQLVQARQSDRSYDKERPVEPEKLERILEAARLAPSACNAQPWKFVVITDKELAQKAGKAAAVDHRRRICARLHEGNGCGKCHGYPGRILSL